MMLSSPWRADFPALANLAHQGLVYLDSAATAQKPQPLLDALQHYYAQGVANVHRAQHRLGNRTTQAFEQVREQVAHWLQAPVDSEIIFTRGTTEAINLLAYGLEAQIQPGDELVISALEHHANLLPWQQLALRRGARLVVLPLDASGQLDLVAAQSLIGPRTRILAISQLSNVLGNWLPLKPLIQQAQAQGAWVVVDGAQGIVHQPPNLKQLGCDFYVFSSHKVYGPDGLGVLYGRRAALAQLQPWQFGGEMLDHTDYYRAQFRPAPLGFEAGTPPIASVLGFAATLNYLYQIDQAAWIAHEQRLHSNLLTGLQQRSGIRILGQPQAALVSFTHESVHPSDLAQLISEQGVAIRAGSHCAQPLMQHLGINGALRVSLGLYNDQQDLERFFQALDQALELLV